MVFMNKCARSQDELSTGALGQNNLAILVHWTKGCFCQEIKHYLLRVLGTNNLSLSIIDSCKPVS